MAKGASVDFSRGVMAEFPSGEALRAACRALSERGIGAWEAFSPYPEEGIEELKARQRRSVSRPVLLGGIAALLSGYAILYFSSVIDYPYAVGGRPVHSWPAFLPILFELTVLGAALTAVGLALFGNGLPAWAHPVFFCENFETASGTGRFLWVSCRDEHAFLAAETILQEAGASSVNRKEGGA